MSENKKPADLQEVVDRSYRVQWGGKRLYLTSAIVLFALAFLSGVALVAADDWFGIEGQMLHVVELSALVTSFVCLIVGVLFALESLRRSQRERGQVPDRRIHAALSLSVVTVASLLFLFFLFFDPGAMKLASARVIRLVIFIFSGFTWFGATCMSSAAFTIIASRRSDLLEVNNTNQGTALVFRKGRSAEIVKLSVAALIVLITFVVALLMAGAALAL